MCGVFIALNDGFMRVGKTPGPRRTIITFVPTRLEGLVSLRDLYRLRFNRQAGVEPNYSPSTHDYVYHRQQLGVGQKNIGLPTAGSIGRQCQPTISLSTTSCSPVYTNRSSSVFLAQARGIGGANKWYRIHTGGRGRSPSTMEPPPPPPLARSLALPYLLTSSVLFSRHLHAATAGGGVPRPGPLEGWS